MQIAIKGGYPADDQPLDYIDRGQIGATYDPAVNWT